MFNYVFVYFTGLLRVPCRVYFSQFSYALVSIHILSSFCWNKQTLSLPLFRFSRQWYNKSLYTAFSFKMSCGRTDHLKVMAFWHKGITYLQVTGHIKLLIYYTAVQRTRLQIWQELYLHYISHVLKNNTSVKPTSSSCQNHLQHQILCCVQLVAHPADAEISRFAVTLG